MNTLCDTMPASSIRAKAAWARLIRKVYAADPLECPKCKGPMHVIALIEDPGVIRRILEHLKLWAPLATERSPPLAAASWQPYASLPLTYHTLCAAVHNGCNAEFIVMRSRILEGPDCRSF